MSNQLTTIRRLVKLKTNKYSNNRIEKYLEYTFNNKLIFRCFNSDYQAYRFDINGKLEHLGVTKTKKEFAELIYKDLNKL